MTNSILFKMAAKTDQGKIRKNNEDNFLVNQDLADNDWFCPQDPDQHKTLSEAGCLLAVADGMGGMNAGEEASKIAIETVKEMFAGDKLPKDASSIEKYLKSVIAEADRRIKEKANEEKCFEYMGTTLVLSWIKGNKAHIVWCGDSRAYSFRLANGLRQLSKDHSHVQELVDAGAISQDDVFDHPLNNIVTQSLGDPDKPAKADYLEYTLHDNETLLLCSDGLNGELRDHEIEKIFFDNCDTLISCSEMLINEALNAGGRDNITIALCQITVGLPDLDNNETSVESKKVESSVRQTIKEDTKKMELWKTILFLLVTLVGIVVSVGTFLYLLKK